MLSMSPDLEIFEADPVQRTKDSCEIQSQSAKAPAQHPARTKITREKLPKNFISHFTLEKRKARPSIFDFVLHISICFEIRLFFPRKMKVPNPFSEKPFLKLKDVNDRSW